ncbi:c-type cytochrome [Comamonas sp. UBA7528]|uniref:c-type cytochrome n=1 Tax=Comamonas sp. UBA7528 TaxID=1946391 RepID=UPI0039C873CD
MPMRWPGLAAAALWAALCAAIGAGAAQAAPASAPLSSPSPWAGQGVVPRLQDSHVAACTACHGPQGRATPSGYFPRIAGKPEEYLYQQLLNFRDGRRSYPLMGHLLQHLDDGMLQGMARYFAALEVPYPPPEPPASTAARLARGAQLVRQGDAARGIPACTQCHGDQLTGSLPAVPGLLGLSRDYLNSQFGAWRTGRRAARAPDCMAQVAKGLALEDVADLSAWLATQPVPVPSKPAAPAAARWPLPCGAAPQPGEGRP